MVWTATRDDLTFPLRRAHDIPPHIYMQRKKTNVQAFIRVCAGLRSFVVSYISATIEFTVPYLCTVHLVPGKCYGGP